MLTMKAAILHAKDELNLCCLPAKGCEVRRIAHFDHLSNKAGYGGDSFLATFTELQQHEKN